MLFKECDEKNYTLLLDGLEHATLGQCLWVTQVAKQCARLAPLAAWY